MSNDEQRISDQIDGGQLAMKEAGKQQTAVDWLEKNMPDISNYIPDGVALEFSAKFEQAKKIFCIQIEDAYNVGSCADMIEYGKGSDYYNQTFQS